MVRYAIKRILLLIPVILAVSFIVFMLIELMPGSFVDSLIGGDMTPEDVAALRVEYNLDRSVFYRYGLYMINLLQGDLGVSMASGLPVFGTFMSRLPNTLLLAFAASVIGVAISIPLGIRAARKAGTVTDTAATAFTLVGMSMPVFWLGLLMLLLFSQQLKWFPAGSNKEGIRSLILPAVCSAMALTALCARQTRASMLEVLKADFLRTARAKGAPEETVIRKHALGNALIPIITAIGGSICHQLAASAVIEQVFAWPGIGRMLVEGVGSRDTTVILGCTIMTTILYVLVMLIVDLLYAVVDPRVRMQFVKKVRKNQSAATQPPPCAPEPEPALAAVPPSPVPCTLTPDPSPLMTPDSLPLPTAPYTYSGAQDYVTRNDRDIVLGDLFGEDAAEVIAKYKKRSQMGEIWHRLVRNKSSLAGIIILSFLAIVALCSLFMPFSAVTTANVPVKFTPPSWQYPFGTDSLGRNLFLRVIYGTRYSIIIGFGAVTLSSIFGVSLGAIAGYYGGKTDNIIMRVSDVLASIPGLMLGMVIMIVLGMSLRNLIIAAGVTGIPHLIRISRASILTVKGNEFVEAARAIGFSDFRIISTQVIPNGLSPILVQATVALGLGIMMASSLSFLGFGIPAPTPEWGALVSAGRDYARAAPWLMAFPGVAIMMIVLGLNLLGDGLRDALDPKLKK